MVSKDHQKENIDLKFEALLRAWLVLAIAVFCAAIPAWAADYTHPRDLTHLLCPGIGTVADMDGDRILDAASGVKIAHTEQGYVYRVDLDLSASHHPASFTVLSKEDIALSIEARDVDGDHDPDLVITSHLSHKLIGIWINDGKGQFTRGDAAKYVSSVWQHRDSLSSSDQRDLPQVITVERWRPLFDVESSPIIFSSAQVSANALRSTTLQLPSVSIACPRFRGPPIQVSILATL